MNPNIAYIFFDIHIPEYKSEKTLEEKRQSIIKLQQENTLNYTISERKSMDMML